MKEGREFHNPLIQLAYDAIEAYLLHSIRISPPSVYYKILETKTPCYVSIFRNGKLRGYHGTIDYKEVTLGVEIISNVIQAATLDTDHTPLKPEELADIEIMIEVLDRMRECSRESLDPKEFGIVVEQEETRGIALPTPDDEETKDEQVARAAKDGQIDLDSEFRILRFKTVKYEADSVVT